MTKQQAKDFIAKNTTPNTRSFVKPSHLEELSPLLEVQIEAVEVRKDEFHELEGGKNYAPKKETLDKFAHAAGINYNTAAETTRKEGDGCYVGTTQGMVMGPDGKWQMGAVCEYEFDVEVRLEEAKINGKPDWENKVNGRPGKRMHTEQELALERIQFMKVGRQRANTGARSRATLAMLGMQTGFKGLFTKDDPDHKTVTFLFSRIIVNAKNEMVAKVMLEGMRGNTAALFGPTPGAQQMAIAHAAPDAEPRRVGPGSDDFDPTGGEPAPTPEVMRLAALDDLVTKYAPNIAPAGLERARAAIANKDDAEVTLCLNGIKATLEKQGVLFGGAA